MEVAAQKKCINSKMVDDSGNTLLIVRNDNIIVLWLKLKSETRKRKIGFINTNTKTLYVERVREKHLFRKLNAYGFCHSIIQDAKKFDNIRLKDDYFEWLIPVEFILDKNNAPFLHFKGEGFELQVFLPLDVIEKFKRPERF